MKDLPKIISDSPQLEESIGRYLKYVLMPEGTKDMTFIDVNLCKNPGDRRTDRKGIDEAIRQMEQGRKIVLFSFESPQSLYSPSYSREYTGFMKIMAQPDSYFLRLPDLHDELFAELAEPKFYNQAMDLASTAITSKSTAGIILHGMNDDNQNEKLDYARKTLRLKGTDDEVMTALKDLRDKAKGIEYQGTITGLFVDVEGTLCKDGKIDMNVLDRMIDYSKKGPVTIWTGGDVDNLSATVGKLFTKACIERGSRLYTRTPILSKYMFKGCEVESVIDDLVKSKFEKEY